MHDWCKWIQKRMKIMKWKTNQQIKTKIQQIHCKLRYIVCGHRAAVIFQVKFERIETTIRLTSGCPVSFNHSCQVTHCFSFFDTPLWKTFHIWRTNADIPLGENSKNVSSYYIASFSHCVSVVNALHLLSFSCHSYLQHCSPFATQPTMNTTTLLFWVKWIFQSIQWICEVVVWLLLSFLFYINSLWGYGGCWRGFLHKTNERFWARLSEWDSLFLWPWQIIFIYGHWQPLAELHQQSKFFPLAAICSHWHWCLTGIRLFFLGPHAHFFGGRWSKLKERTTDRGSNIKRKQQNKGKTERGTEEIKGMRRQYGYFLGPI